MDETITNQEPLQGMVFTQEAQYYLNETAGWSKFLGIMGFIFCGLILIGAFSIGSLLTYVSRFSPSPQANFPGTLVGIIYGLMALLYFFPSLYAFQFGTKTKRGILFQDSIEVADAIEKMKSFFKFWGIIMIISLALTILSLIGILAGAAAMHSMR